MLNPYLWSLIFEKTNPAFGKLESLGFPVWLHVISLNLRRLCLGQLKLQGKKKALRLILTRRLNSKLLFEEPA